jgi:hypothetical protein
MNLASPKEAALPLEVVRHIDALADRFEVAVRAGVLSAKDDLLHEVEAPYRSALLKCLLAVELEYRRAWGERPSRDEYMQLHPQHAAAVLAAFDENEDLSCDVSPADLCAVQIALAQASGRRMDRLRVYFRGELRHTAAFGSPLELGRQRPGEATPFALTEGRQGDRLVIAPLEETTVSRHHALLVPEGNEAMRVTNLSQVNPIILPETARLPADRSETLPLPLEMSLGSIVVRIDQPDADGASGSSGSSGSGNTTSKIRRGLLQRLGRWRK